MNTKTALTVVMMTVLSVSLHGSDDGGDVSMPNLAASVGMRRGLPVQEELKRAESPSPIDRPATPTRLAGAISSDFDEHTPLTPGGTVYAKLAPELAALEDSLNDGIDNGVAAFESRAGAGTGYREYVVDGATEVWGQAVTAAGKTWDGTPDTRTVATGVAHGVNVVVYGAGALTKTLYGLTRGATLKRRAQQVEDGLEAFGEDPEYQREVAVRAAAATKIQAFLRGHQARKHLEQRQSAATTIQTAWRRHQAR